MSSYLDSYAGGIEAHQREKLEEHQVQNAAGGYVYEISLWDKVRRFLIMGTEGGTYYEGERDLTKQNVDNIKLAIQEDGTKVVEMAREVSVEGRAAKNDMALFVLALCATHGDQATKDALYKVYNSVARIGTHHLMFVSFVSKMRGWGRGLRRMLGDWYIGKSDDDLAYQVIKFRNREGWTHGDVLSKTHHGRNTGLYRWIVGADTGRRVIEDNSNGNRIYPSVPVGNTGENPPVYPELVYAFEKAQALGNDDTAKPAQIIKLIKDHNLTHEMIHNKFKNSVEVWEALLQRMPIHATVRNLGKMTSINMFEPFTTNNVGVVLDKFTPESIKRSRMHPITLLNAMRVYESGGGVLGSLKWKPNRQILSRLEDAFYWGFDAIEPSNLNMLLALDTSGSMFWNAGEMKAFPMLDSGTIAAVMAMVTARVEPNYHICAFDGNFTELSITDKMSLGQVVSIMQGLPHGRTDCGLPMRYAMRAGWHNIDGFVIYTDNETWAGNVHPKRALEMYRDKFGQNARLAVSAMTATDTSIADPSVPYMLDLVGISTDTPRIISEFIAGKI